MRSAPAAAFLAWLAWTLLVVMHYFAIPEELLIVFDGPLREFPYWREAIGEGTRGFAGAAAVLLGAWGAGSLLTRRLDHLFATTAERVLVVLAVGLAALGAGCFLLALLHLYSRPVLVPVLLLLAAGGGLTVILAVARNGRRVPRIPELSWQEVLLASCASAAAACSLVGALAPESEYDALWYHLWIPARWLDAGRPVDIIEEFVSLYPLGWDLVGGAAMALGGPIAAKLLHFSCLPLLGVTTFRLTRQLAPGASGMLGAALAMMTPITIWEATTAYLDLALAWYVSLSVYALARYDSSRERGWLVLSALMMSAALAVKHLGLLAMAIVTGVLAARELHRSRRARRALGVTALFVAISLALPGPWYLRAYLASGNPVFPDMYRVFGAEPPERWSPATQRGLQGFKDRFGNERTAANLIRLPWDATVHAASFGGTLGPLFLILVPAALIGRRVRRTSLVLALGCTAYVALWASPISSFQMRFLIPIVPMLAVLGAEGAARVQRVARAANRGAPTLAFASILVLLLFNLPPTSGWHEPDRAHSRGWMTHIVRALPVRVVLGAESRQEYLARTVPSYGAWQYIDSLPPTVKILTFSGGDHLYSTRPRLWSDATMTNPATWGTPAGEEGVALEVMRRLGITHVLFDKRQLQDGSVRALAVGSEDMLACCLALEWEDDRFALYRLREEGVRDTIPSAGGPSERPAPSALGAGKARRDVRLRERQRPPCVRHVELALDGRPGLHVQCRAPIPPGDHRA